MRPYRLGYCVIGDVDPDGLPEVERRIALSVGAQHRRNEIAAGRAAARQALAALTGEPAERFVIDRAPDGAPVVLGGGATVSITHGKTVAAAAVGFMDTLGIDLCDRSQAERIERVTQRYLDPDERRLAEGGDDLTWATLWALKEAAAKALRRGLLSDRGLHASRLASLDPARFESPELEVDVLVEPQWVVAVVFRS